MKLADKILQSLRPAFSREASYKWFTVVAIAFLCGPDKGGMAGIVRAIMLNFSCYSPIEHLFRSTAFTAETLLLYWRNAVLEHAPLYRLEDGRAVIIGDGTKHAKEGLYMPGVKKHHQESGNSSKPSYIFGQLWGGIGICASAGGASHCIPLSLTIQNGLAQAFGWDGREERTESHVLQCVKAACEASMAIEGGAVGVFDSYFMSVEAVKAALAAGMALIVRAKPSYAAYEKPERNNRGRPRKKGAKVKLGEVFEAEKGSFVEKGLELYGSTEAVRMHSKILLWGKDLLQPILFVFAESSRGKIIAACTDLSMAAETVLELYGKRFSIESMFKALKQALLAFGAQFWTKALPKLNRFAKKGDPDPLEAVSDRGVQKKILRAIESTERYMAIACIAAGILQMIAMKYAQAGEKPSFRFVRTEHKKAPSVDSIAAGFKIILGLLPDNELFGTFQRLEGLRIKADEIDVLSLRDIA